MTEYDDIIREIKERHEKWAKDDIPRACYALAKEPYLSKKDINDRVKKDLIEIWSPATISRHMPEEFKDEQKQTAGKQSQKNRIERSALNSDQKITISTEGSPINNTDDDKEALKLENGRLKEMIQEQKQQTGELVKSLNAAASLKKEPNKDVRDSLEYQTLLSRFTIVEQERDEFKQLATMQMKQHPSETFQSAAEIPGITTVTTTIPNEVEFPARDLSTFFLDSRNASKVMYLKLDGKNVVGWESDVKRSKNK